MMRKIILLLLAVALPLAMLADNIEQEQAHQIACKFLATKSYQTSNKRLARAEMPSLTCIDEGFNHLYTFVDETNGGFVIVADNDRIEPVLAYSETDIFDPQMMPVPMQMMLQSYDQQIENFINDPVRTRQSESPVEREIIPPLIQTMWHQYLPLNYKCPFDDNANRNTLVGCAAIVLGQLMYYYKYPQSTTLSIPGYTTGTGYNMPELLPTTFDYEKMYLNYDYVDTREEVDPNDASIAEVTKLLMYAGCAVQMNYSVNGSASVFDTEIIAKYFGFDKGAHRLMARNYSHDTWEEMVYQELKAGRPVPYSAAAIGNQTHQFIIDGYDGNGYFHANIGEIGRGSYNVYYKLGVLNYCMDQTGQVEFSGYNVSQAAIFDFQPDMGNEPGVIDEPLPTSVPNLEVSKVEYYAAYEGEKLNARAYFTNNGTNYENELYFWIDGMMRTGVGAYVDPGMSDYVDFCTGAPAIGLHEVAITTDEEGGNVIFKGQMSVTEAPTCQLEAKTETKGFGDDRNVHGQLDISCEITNTGETAFDNMIMSYLEVYKDDGKGGITSDVPNGIPSTIWKRVWYLHLDPGESTTLSFALGKDVFKPKDYKYAIILMYYNNKWRQETLYNNGYFNYFDNDETTIKTIERTEDTGV